VNSDPARKSVKAGDRRFGSVLGEIDNRRLFQAIVRNGKEHRFRQLPPAGISRFETFIQSNILAESALTAKHLKHELEPLRTIIAEVSSHLESLQSGSFLRRRFQDLLNLMRHAETKLAGTAPN
jgi:hypothetical protein